jgi:uncharacterized protein YfbU (UPF0304 family)
MYLRGYNASKEIKLTNVYKFMINLDSNLLKYHCLQDFLNYSAYVLSSLGVPEAYDDFKS